MKTLHINTERSWRGGEQQTLYLTAELHARGFDTALVCRPGVELEERARRAGVPVHPVNMRGEWDLAAALAIRRILRGGGFHLVHGHTSHAHTMAVLASAFGRKARVVVSRRVDFSIHRHPFSLSGLKYRAGVDRYIAISRAVREQLVRDGVDGNKIRVVYSGVDLSRFKERDREGARRELGLGPKAYVLGTVAHFARHKGLELLVEAFRAVREKIPAAHLLLVGHGERFEAVRGQAKRTCPPGSVIFPGFRNDVPRILGAMDLFVMPSTREGLCTSILDALAARRPVVASAAGGIPEIITHGETGLLIPPGDKEALAGAVLELASSPETAAALAEAGRRRVEKDFSVKAMVEGVLQVYGELLEGNRAETC